MSNSEIVLSTIRPEEGLAVIEKQTQALQVVNRYKWFSAGAGLIPIPYLDATAVSALQLKMLAEISKIYGVPFQENLGKAAIASLASFVITQAAAFGTLSKAVPGLSAVAAPATAAFAWGYSWAVGNLFIQHFESGGTLLDFDPLRFREYFKSQFAIGQKATPVVEG